MDIAFATVADTRAQPLVTDLDSLEQKDLYDQWLALG